jgi:hypothetical protein
LTGCPSEADPTRRTARPCSCPTRKMALGKRLRPSTDDCPNCGDTKDRPVTEGGTLQRPSRDDSQSCSSGMSCPMFRDKNAWRTAAPSPAKGKAAIFALPFCTADPQTNVKDSGHACASMLLLARVPAQRRGPTGLLHALRGPAHTLFLIAVIALPAARYQGAMKEWQ